ncbi:NRDE family protein [Metapseudomonas resinovorans]|uniref:NRDE family protein n=1 Tax=Metapseudomonas resinovorans NBRC 106553 TaxID=1245471 RepID=S6BA91_METRE|nr:NRDE family protein [Pseudomonas resinovorans]BAN45969.1 hypothetical protein PCA10_02370 [Pseudomonas resinovorans NBRC 106553]
MCLIVFAWRPGHEVPLVLAANRDEFYARPTLPLAKWEDAPGVLAGRDLEAGGTWLGAGPKGRFAALTNIRDPRTPPVGRTRGELCVQFLRGEMGPGEFLEDAMRRAGEYSGFNLLVGDDRELWFLNPRSGGPINLKPGIYGVSNADLDTPWPKVERGKAAIAECLEPPTTDALLNLLHDPEQAQDHILPETGVGLNTERMLSSVFIATRTYGTRASSALIVRADGSRELVERSYGPYGAKLGDVRLELRD